MILNAIGDFARMSALVHLEAVRDAVLVKNIVKFGGVAPQSVLVADIHRNAAILAQVVDVLVGKGERRIGRPFREGFQLRLAVFGRQIKIQRWTFWIRGPCRCCGERGPREERQVGGVFRLLHSLQSLVHFWIRGGPRR